MAIINENKPLKKYILTNQSMSKLFPRPFSAETVKTHKVLTVY